MSNAPDFNFPIVVLKEIFKQLPNQKERIKCSFVSRKWRMVYQQFLTEISPNILCLHLEKRTEQRKLIFTNIILTDSNFFRIPNLEFFESDFSKIHLSFIKKLVINLGGEVYENRNKIFDPEFINKTNGEWINRDDFCGLTRIKLDLKKQLNYFPILEHLELIKLEIFSEDLSIDLSNLKILNIEFCSFFDERCNKRVLELNTKSLENLVLYGMTIFWIKLNYPQTLKYLEINGSLDKLYNTFFSDEFTKFKNLEFCFGISLDCMCKFKREDMLNEKILENLPNLRFIFDKTIDGLNSPNFIDSNSKKLRIVKSLDPFELDSNLDELVYYKDYLYYYPIKFYINYNKLLENQIPLNHFKENFLRIQCLKIGNVENGRQLIDFIKNIGYLEELKLKSSFNLGQEFFDSLSTTLSCDKLFIEWENSFYQLQNYEFTKNLNVNELKIEFYKLPYKTFETIFENKYWNYFSFETKFYEYNQMIDDVHKVDLEKWIIRKNNVYVCLTCFGVWSFYKFKTIEEIKDHVETTWKTKSVFI